MINTHCPQCSGQLHKVLDWDTENQYTCPSCNIVWELHSNADPLQICGISHTAGKNPEICEGCQ